MEAPQTPPRAEVAPGAPGAPRRLQALAQNLPPLIIPRRLFPEDAENNQEENNQQNNQQNNRRVDNWRFQPEEYRNFDQYLE